MTEASTNTVVNREHGTKTNTRLGSAARFMRALGLWAVVLGGGLLAGLFIVRATSVLRQIPQDGPLIWVRSGCGAAEAAVRAASHAPPDHPIFLIPLDQKSEAMKQACDSTLSALEREGSWWLRIFPESWLCQRFAEEATAQLDVPIPVPRFHLGGKHICDGLCQGAFERLGYPGLDRFATLITPGSGEPDGQ